MRGGTRASDLGNAGAPASPRARTPPRVAFSADAPAPRAQVLESLAKGGVPTRGEVTDAASSGRAEAVMLNKGPFMASVLSLLRDVLGRMQAHESKKMHLMRQLNVSRHGPAVAAPGAKAG